MIENRPTFLLFFSRFFKIFFQNENGNVEIYSHEGSCQVATKIERKSNENENVFLLMVLTNSI